MPQAIHEGFALNSCNREVAIHCRALLCLAPFGRLIRPLQPLKVLDRGLHFVLTEEGIHIVDKALDLVTDEGKVEHFKLSEHLGGKDVVDTAEDGTAAGGIYGNKELKLLYDTVTESNAELLDNVKVELFDHIEILLLNGRLVDRLLIKGVKLGEANG